MSNTDGEDTQKVSLGELLLNAGTRIVDLEKQSNDQVEIITHLEKQLASLREQLAQCEKVKEEKHKRYDELFASLSTRNDELNTTRKQLKQKEDENRELVECIEAIRKCYLNQMPLNGYEWKRIESVISRLSAKL